jgi:hypothetical protein
VFASNPVAAHVCTLGPTMAIWVKLIPSSDRSIRKPDSLPDLSSHDRLICDLEMAVSFSVVGAAGTGTTIVTVAEPDRVPTAAPTTEVPAEVGAVNNPVEVIEPPPLLTDHVNDGWVAMALPNWSLATAANCFVVPILMVVVAGLTAIDVSVWLTVTVTSLVVVNDPSEIVARSV